MRIISTYTREKILLFSFISTLLAGFVSGEEKLPVAAVLDFDAKEGISLKTSQLLSDYLRIQLSQTRKYTIVSRENMKEVLKEQKFQECNTTVCIVEAGKLLGASKMFGGSIGKVGSTYLLTLKLIDVETGVQENSVAEECEKCAEESLIVAIRNISKKICGEQGTETTTGSGVSGSKEITGKDGAVMVLIPAGEFMMGSPSGEGEDYEKPQHRVYLDAYYIDKYEVTVGQYRKYCEATGRRMHSTRWRWIDSHPVMDITWDDAVAYARYYGKRLPTEAEWEKACRAGSSTRYSYGDAEMELGEEYAWYLGNAGGQTHPVGQKKPNAWGLYDIHGNVCEWCSDWDGEDYYRNSPSNNPKGPSSGTARVLRGGSWGCAPDNCRSAYRRRGDPSIGNFITGFRCAASAAQ